jgi:hypothetical protein
MLSSATSASLLRAAKPSRGKRAQAPPQPSPASGAAPAVTSHRAVEHDARRARIAAAVQHRARYDSRFTGRCFGAWRDCARRHGIRHRRNARVVEVTRAQRERKVARTMLLRWAAIAATSNPALIAQADTFSRWRILLHALRGWCVVTRHGVAERAAAQMRVRLRYERERERAAQHHLRMRRLSHSWLLWMVHHRHHRHHRILEGKHLERRAKMELVLAAQQRKAEALRHSRSAGGAAGDAAAAASPLRKQLGAATVAAAAAAAASPRATTPGSRALAAQMEVPMDALSFISQSAMPPVATPPRQKRAVPPRPKSQRAAARSPRHSVDVEHPRDSQVSVLYVPLHLTRILLTI